MSDPAVLKISLDPELHAALMAAAETADRPVTEIVSDLVRDYVALGSQEPDYDDCLRQRIEIARVSTRAGYVCSNEDMEALFSALRRELLTQSP
jgi:hypothetical protein